jgi:phage tail-like protein
MQQISSYTNYLPAVLWSRDQDPSQFLARMLCAFEKILTGIDDGVKIDGKPVESIEKTIDNLSHVFNPWCTDSRFLDWLAAWVALDLPEEWKKPENEYRTRKLIADIVSIYQSRGLMAGLYTYLDIYCTSKARPRVAVDDGEAVLRGALRPDGSVQLHAVAYSHTVSGVQVLLHPSAVAADSKDDYVIADLGSDEDTPRKPSLWKMPSTGQFEYKETGAQPLPKPLYPVTPADNVLRRPVAVVVDGQDNYYVLDVGPAPGQFAIYKFAKPKYQRSTVINSLDPTVDPNAKKVICPVDMIRDSAGNFIVLDRCRYPFGASPPSPAGAQIFIIQAKKVLGPFPLQDVIEEPTALVARPPNHVIIADAKCQFGDTPADLVQVELNTGDLTCKTQSLLENLDSNPLIFPTGLAFVKDKLYVCDTGMRWGFVTEEGKGTPAAAEIPGDRSNRWLAEPAGLYGVTLAESEGVRIVRVAADRSLVHPSKLAVDGAGNLVMTERGDSFRDHLRDLDWRGAGHQFGTAIHFSQERPTGESERRTARRAIARVVEEQKPGHTFWRLGAGRR